MQCILKHIHIVTYACIVLTACDMSYETQEVHVSFSPIPNTLMDISTQKILFFIRDNTIVSRTFSPDTTDTTIAVQKTGVIPVLLCEQFFTQKVSITECPYSQGGVFPFITSTDTHYIFSLHTQHHAQVAQLLLKLFVQHTNIQLLNVKKLYDAINKYSPSQPIDIQKVQDYVKKGNLSSWAIRSMTSHTLTTEGIPSFHWISTSYWVPDIDTNHDTMLFYSGRWLFIKKDISTLDNTQGEGVPLLWIYVDEHGSHTHEVLLHQE